jgi:PKD repeat protein
VRVLLAVALAVLAAGSGCIQINVGPQPDAAATHQPHAADAEAQRDMPQQEFKVDFTATPDIAAATRPVTFQATVQGLGEDRSFDTLFWDFGDGEELTCTGEDLGSCFRVTHTYETAGDYEVGLNVLVSDGDSQQRVREIIVVNPR